MPRELSHEETIKAQEETSAYLETIGTALNNPFTLYQNLTQEITALEKAIKRLWAFVGWITALNIAQYWEWMRKAFSNYQPSKPAVQPEVAIEPKMAPQPALPHFDSEESQPGTKTRPEILV